jgi:hypothetical protein
MAMEHAKNSDYKLPHSVDDYFARKPSEDCVSECAVKLFNYYAEMNRSGRRVLYKNSYYHYYEGFILKGMIYNEGEQGELNGIWINNYRNFVNHLLVMTCQQRLAYEPQTADGSHAALEQVRLAKGLLQLYTARSDMDIDGVLRQATEQSLIFTESYVACLWDPTKGKPVAIDTENATLQPEGDVSLRVYNPFDVVRDIYQSYSDTDDWIILREEVNKFNLATLYPVYETEILTQGRGPEYAERQLIPCLSDESNLIYVYKLFHRRMPIVPKGRYTVFVNERIVLEDGPMPDEYEEIPVYRMAMGEIYGSPWGYSKAFDILPICDSINRLNSAVLTNNLTFATQNLLVPRDAGIDGSSLYGGLNIISYDASKGPQYKPEALQLTASSAETYNYLNALTQNAGTIMGVNEVIRGNPDLVLKGQVSGQSLALMSTNSIQFNSDLQKAYVRLAERIGTAIIKLLAKKSVTLREGKTIGMSSKMYSKQFKGSDLSKIDKVVIKTGNPLSQTPSGRMQIAEGLQAGGWLTNRQDYLQVLETGNLDPMLESYDREMSLIKDENDKISQGLPIPDAVVYDDHVNHILEHKVLASSVEARLDTNIMNVLNKHIQSHIDFLAGNAQHGPMNPILAKLLNQPGLPPGTPDQIVLPLPPPPPPQGGAAVSRPPVRPQGPRAGSASNAMPTPNQAPISPQAVKLPPVPNQALLPH